MMYFIFINKLWVDLLLSIIFILLSLGPYIPILVIGYNRTLNVFIHKFLLMFSMASVFFSWCVFKGLIPVCYILYCPLIYLGVILIYDCIEAREPILISFNVFWLLMIYLLCSYERESWLIPVSDLSIWSFPLDIAVRKKNKKQLDM